MARLASVCGVCACLALLSSTGGCAYTQATVTLPKLLQPAPPSGGREVVLVGPFVDARRDRGRCGMKKNGYNGDTADVLCAEDPSTWVARRLASDLRAVGVVVHDAPHGSALRIEGTLLQFFTEPKPEAFTVELETDIHVVLTATWPSGAVADKELYVKATETSAAGNDASFQASVNDASTHMSRDLLISVLALLERPAPPGGAR
ncbi:MAG: exported protein of unknown function [Myxococcaceae bacterium]|nr:exported protein of unknown function [Myxococcaceae bacterium]MEA2747941.1 hypothetical protein [Myxococcales bacterium]